MAIIFENVWNAELLADINMLMFIEKDIQGGISMICHRYAQANIPNTPEFNKHDDPRYTMYWDVNNLYGWTMSQFLTFIEFQWCATEHISEEGILSLPDDSEIGYIFEVDLNILRNFINYIIKGWLWTKKFCLPMHLDYLAMQISPEPLNLYLILMINEII